MGLGIREPSGKSHIPGTVKLYESGPARSEAALQESGELPFARRSKKSRDGVITLVPQPSDSPNDPLVSHP